MKRGTDFAKAIPANTTRFYAAFQGAGAADMTLATDAQFPREANLGLTCTRTGIGLFTMTLSDCTAQMLVPTFAIIDTAGEGLRATAKSVVDPVAKTLVVNVWDPGGALDDIENTGTLIVTFDGYDTSV